VAQQRTLVIVDDIPMSESALDVLKAGLTKLKDDTKARKDDLLARLHRKEEISAEEEEWLDNTANLVDEEAIVDSLETASDYERGLGRLNPQQKYLVDKLKELGGGIEHAGDKRKRNGVHYLLRRS
jgi:ribosome assembly protein YihI (activator of Der GTPase)